MVEKKDKHGNPLIIAFAEFETPHQAAASLKTLQDYPLDMATPNENRLRLSFAKPLKNSDPRSRGPGGGGGPFNPRNDSFRYGSAMLCLRLCSSTESQHYCIVVNMTASSLMRAVTHSGNKFAGVQRPNSISLLGKPL